MDTLLAGSRGGLIDSNDSPTSRSKVVYDEHRSGRPSKLSDKEHEQFVEALHKSPEEVGLDAPAWSVPLARHYLAEEFDVEYCERHVRRLMTEAGLSWKTARPSFTNPMREHRKHGKTGSKKRDNLDDEYTILAIDQTRQVLSTLIHAWFPKVSARHSR